MAKRVKIPWLVGKNEMVLPHYFRAFPEDSDEGTGWTYSDWGSAEPCGPESPYPGTRDVERTHTLRWQDQEDIKGVLVLTGIGRGRSSAIMYVRILREDLPSIQATISVNAIQQLWPFVKDGSVRVIVGARKRGQNYLLEVLTCGDDAA
jgi:hypothetical protein